MRRIIELLVASMFTGTLAVVMFLAETESEKAVSEGYLWLCVTVAVWLGLNLLVSDDKNGGN